MLHFICNNFQILPVSLLFLDFLGFLTCHYDPPFVTAPLSIFKSSISSLAFMDLNSLILRKHAKSHAVSVAVAQASLFSGIRCWWAFFPLPCRNRIQCRRHVHFFDLAWIIISHIFKNRTMNPFMLYVMQHNNITFQTVEWITSMSHIVKPMYQVLLYIYFLCIPHLILKEMSCVLYLHLTYTNKNQETEVDELVWFRKLLNRRLSKLKEISYSIHTP